MKFTRSHLRPRRSGKQHYKRAKLKRGSPKWHFLQEDDSSE
jgi:hypothetical protein